MLRYPCLVLDHDDTVVQSEATINYPCFCEILQKFRPGDRITLQEYMEGCFHEGFQEMCRRRFRFTEQELLDEYLFWQGYIRNHVPMPFPGIDRVIKKQKQLGGKICVVSHSSEKIILRDYKAHFGLAPDLIFGWDYPESQRKPSAYPLQKIMEIWGLPPSELVVVDDMKPAWEMARKVNVSIGFAGWARDPDLKMAQEMKRICDFSFFSPEELENFLFDY